MTEEHVRRTPDGYEEPEFEQQDLSAKSVFGFLAGLAVAVSIVVLILVGTFKLLDRSEARNQPEQNPLTNKVSADTRAVTEENTKKFPEPRLESNERSDINKFRLQEEQTLNSYGWVDQKAGVVHIPIDRAMGLIAERGLPTRPQTGTVPPSTVNMSKEAAAKSDRSQKPKK